MEFIKGDIVMVKSRGDYLMKIVSIDHESQNAILQSITYEDPINCIEASTIDLEDIVISNATNKFQFRMLFKFNNSNGQSLDNLIFEGWNFNYLKELKQNHLPKNLEILFQGKKIIKLLELLALDRTFSLNALQRILAENPNRNEVDIQEAIDRSAR